MVRYAVITVLLAGQATAQFIAPAQLVNAANAATAGSGYAACISAQDAIDYCSSVLGDLATAPEDKVGQCLCCSGSSYVPTVFDQYAETCASYIQTAMPKSTSAYSAFSSIASFCEAEGNVCQGGAAPTGTITGGATRTSGGGSSPTVCDSVAAIVSECANGNPDYLSEPIDVQAGCYCYVTDGQTVSWVPDLFGRAASQCASWAQTADPEDYAAYQSLATLCSAAGDFLGDGAAVSTITDSAGRHTAVATSSLPYAAQTGTSPAAAATATSPAATATGLGATSINAAAGGLVVQKVLALGAAGVVMSQFLV